MVHICTINVLYPILLISNEFFHFFQFNVLIRYYYLKKRDFKQYLGVISGLFFTLINNIEGKYRFVGPFLASNLHRFGPSYFYNNSRYVSQQYIKFFHCSYTSFS